MSDFVEYFESRGYRVTWDYDKHTEWWEIFGDGLICQVQNKVTLKEFLEDLKKIKDKTYTDPTEPTYWCALPECEETDKFLEKVV